MTDVTGYALELRFERYTSTTVGKFHRTALVGDKVHVQYGGLRQWVGQGTYSYDGQLHTNDFDTPLAAAKKAATLAASKVKKGYYPVTNIRVFNTPENTAYRAMNAFDANPDRDMEEVVAFIMANEDPAVQPYVLSLALMGQDISEGVLANLSDHESEVVRKAVSKRLFAVLLS